MQRALIRYTVCVNTNLAQSGEEGVAMSLEAPDDVQWYAALSNATDDELGILCEAIDALARERPELVTKENRPWRDLVHGVMNEVIARRNWATARGNA